MQKKPLIYLNDLPGHNLTTLETTNYKIKHQLFTSNYIHILFPVCSVVFSFTFFECQ